jgi:hypothetical protein
MPKRIPRYVIRKVHETNPVLLAMTVCLLVAMIPLVLVLEQQSDLRKQQAQIKQTQRDSQANRVAVSRAICVSLNSNSKANNGQSLYLANLVVNSAKQTKPFQKVYDGLGLPSYQERLKQSEAVAHALKGLSVRAIDCEAYLRYVQKLIPPRGANGQPSTRIQIPTKPPEYPKVPGPGSVR